MSNPWRETKGYSFHSICLHVKDIEESSMFYQHVFGMNLIREANVGQIEKVWLQFPADKKDDLFGSASAVMELVQQRGTERDKNFHIETDKGGFHHLCISVPDIHEARHRFTRLGVPMMDVGISQNDLIIVRDPDNYPIQILSQNFDLYAALQAACREVVLDSNQAAMTTIGQSQDPDLLAEAGLPVPAHSPQ
ncbi:hypothetical protein Malapachy_1907 [Malassezia pachydermatis]|uniref:VOC domain-containing protein n=1 Tax=Malassezia pachydermatis TaxID=77020 RepID=A0A0M9VNU6_9BASI|nr:hypothetical protein Malapachy_1907 [Malassezia pachydermatis]KOS13713.1 hypothetical protein Malapachy_1907 [Malassezia pachydermatis]